MSRSASYLFCQVCVVVSLLAIFTYTDDIQTRVRHIISEQANEHGRISPIILRNLNQYPDITTSNPLNGDSPIDTDVQYLLDASSKPEKDILEQNEPHTSVASEFIRANKESKDIHHDVQYMLDAPFISSKYVLEENEPHIPAGGDFIRAAEEATGPTFKKCTPINRIFFTRIHKTGSSTLLNIFYRYMLANNHQIAALKSEVVWPSYTTRDMFIVPPGVEPDYGKLHFYGEHSQYNRSEADRILGVGSFKMASVRMPLSQLRSMIQEWQLAKLMNITTGDPVARYLEELGNGHDLLPGLHTSLLNSNQAQLLGLPFTDVENVSRLPDFLADVDEQFNLILVSEYFDESLVLMRRLLCWDVKHIIYISIRKGKYDYDPEIINWAQEKAYVNRAPGDYAVHKYFTEKLFSAIDTQHLFWSELKRFKDILIKVNKFCRPMFDTLLSNTTRVYDLVEENASIWLNPAPFGDTFTVSTLDCIYMGMYTHAARNLLAIKQYPSLCDFPAQLKYKEICSQPHPVHQVPMEFLALKKIHMPLWEL